MDDVERAAVGLAVARRQAPDLDVEAALWLLAGALSEVDLGWAAARGLGLADGCARGHAVADPGPDRVEATRRALLRAGFAPGELRGR